MLAYVLKSAGHRVIEAADGMDGLQKALQQITGNNALQGVSGQISFGPDNDPTNKAIVVLSVDQNGFIHLISVEGCFLVNQCK